MTANKPYLLRALYEWLIDNNCAPHLLVDTTVPTISMPPQYLSEAEIVINVDPAAVRKLIINNAGVEFEARFGNAIRHIYIPTEAVRAIYAYENGAGMIFGPDNETLGEPSATPASLEPPSTGATDTQPTPAPMKGRPALKIVK